MGLPADLAGKTLAVSLLALGLPAAAAARCVDPLEAGAQTGKSDFVQTRRLAGLSAPLVARGVVEVSATQVDWNVVEPIAIATRITADGVAQSVEGGPYEPLGPQGEDSFVSGAGLFDLLTGDFKAVRTHYEVEQLAPEADGGWRLRLTPLEAGLAAVVSEIGVGGCAAIESVEVRQAGGDVMEISLTRTPESGG